MSLPEPAPTLQVYQRDDYVLTIPFFDTDGVTPLDVHTSAFTPHLGPGIPIGSKTLPASLVWTLDDSDAAVGIITLTLNAADLQLLKTGDSNALTLRWDLTEAGRWDDTILRGDIQLIGLV